MSSPEQKPLPPTGERLEGDGLSDFASSTISGAMEKNKLDMVCTSKSSILPLVAGERVIGHVRLGPRRDCDVVDALSWRFVVFDLPHGNCCLRSILSIHAAGRRYC